MIEYTLIRSKRKTLAIQVTKDAEVIVRSPQRCSQKRIDEFILQHIAWINKHLEKAKKENPKRSELSKEDIENSKAVVYLCRTAGIEAINDCPAICKFQKLETILQVREIPKNQIRFHSEAAHEYHRFQLH